VHSGFWWGNLKERDHFEEAGVDGVIILNGISGDGMGGVDWIDLADNRNG
jgi:hypothetical protein